MLLLFLIAIAQSPAGRGPANFGGAARPQYDLAYYLTVAAAYGSGSRVAGVREIRQWRPREIAAAVNGLRSRAMNLRPSTRSPDDIAFATVEAAVLMHLEAALLAQQDPEPGRDRAPAQRVDDVVRVVARGGGGGAELGRDAAQRLQEELRDR